MELKSLEQCAARCIVLMSSPLDHWLDSLEYPMRAVRATAFALLSIGWGFGSAASAQAPREKVDLEVVAKIKEEGLKRSKVMETLSFLTDVYGPRLTGSPLTRTAGEWATKKLTEWGLEKSHLEPWGPFGRGWTLEGFTANMTAPSYSPLIAFPKAWSPSTPMTI